MRDDFPQRIRETLGRRVNFLCSNPDCPLGTIGPHSDADKSVNKGVAAHISAAAPGGKRYDASMTSEQRSSIDNGIWLCQNCAKLIDSDESRYTTELLRAWKLVAESRVARSMQANEPLPSISTAPGQTTETGDKLANWLHDNVHSAQLSESLPKALQYAKRIGNGALERWVRMELYGYTKDGGMTDDDVVPEYRAVTGRWMDRFNNMLDISHYPDLSIVNEYRFRIAIAKLEELASKQQMQNIADDHMINLLREKMGVDVIRFCFSPIEVRGVLDTIRNRLAEMVLDSLSDAQNTV